MSDFNLDTLPLNEKTAQQGILGLLLMIGSFNTQTAFIEGLNHTFFQDFDYRLAYKQLCEEIKTTKDKRIDLEDFLKIYKGELTEQDFLDSISVLNVYKIEECVDTLYDCYKKSSLKENVAKALANSDFENPDGVVRQLADVVSSYSSKIVPKKTSYLHELSTKYENDVLEPGIPITHSQTLDMAFGGLQSGVYLLGAKSGLGKALDIECPILTPNGWVKNKDLKIGDYVISRNGKKTKVTNIFPQGKLQLYNVKFDDGTEVECCEDHLWYCSAYRERQLKIAPKTRSLKEIMEVGIFAKNNRKIWAIPFCDPIEFEKKDLPINPYLMGLILGGFGTTQCLRVTVTEVDLLERIKSLIDPIESMTLVVAENCDYQIKGNITYPKIRDLGLNCKSICKFIPKDYLSGNIEDRIELLKGLLDTDGYVVDGGNIIEYSTSSGQLAKDIIELVRSLGGRVTSKQSEASYKDKNGVKIICQDKYRLWISFKNGFIPVSSKKHLSKYVGKKQFHQKFIVSIEKTRIAEAQCITVDSEDHTYITKDYIVTHNTNYSVQMSLDVAQQGYNVLYFQLEVTERMIFNKFLANITETAPQTMNSIFDKKMPDGTIIPAKEYAESKGLKVNIDSLRAKYREAGKKFADLPIKLTDKITSESDIEKSIADHFYKGLLKFVVIDYIGLVESDNPRDPEWQRVADFTTKLTKLTIKYDFTALLVVQFTKGNSDKYHKATEDDEISMESISGGSAIYKNATGIMILTQDSRMIAREKDPTASAVEQMARAAYSYCKMTIVKNRLESFGGSFYMSYRKPLSWFREIPKHYVDQALLAFTPKSK